MEQGVSIRQALDTDWDQLLPLLEQMGGVTHPEMSKSIFMNYVCSPDHCIRVAEMQQQILG